MIRRSAAVLVSCLVLAVSCGSSDDQQPTVRVLTHNDFSLPEDALADFTERTGIKVVVFREADSTAVADLLERSRTTPVADVVIGIDTLELTRVIDSRLVEPYRPIGRDKLDADLLIENDWMIPVSYLDACANRSISFYTPPEREVDEFPDPEALPPPIPTSIDAFVDPVHSGHVVIPDARTSRMGLYLLVALARLYPEGTGDPEATAWPQFLDLMLRQGALLTPSWEEAYFSHFLSGTSTESDPELRSTEHPITWGSSGMPAVTVRFQPDLPETVDIEVMRSGCVRIVNYAGMVAGTPNRLDAARFIDAMVEPLFQFGVPDRFGSRPTRSDILRTDAWREFGVEVDAATIDPATVGERWPVWQLTWNQIVTEFETGDEPIEPVVTVTLPDS